MIIKSFILENNIKSIIDKNIFLFYGENLGLKRDFKKKIKKGTSKFRNPKFCSRRNNKKSKYFIQ